MRGTFLNSRLVRVSRVMRASRDTRNALIASSLRANTEQLLRGDKSSSINKSKSSNNFMDIRKELKYLFSCCLNFGYKVANIHVSFNH
jgi:hypothetical protein